MSWVATFLTPAALVAGAIAVSLNVYAVTAGADFGGGVWDLFAFGERRNRQRALIADAIAPIWEANHVWLILVVVLLFTAFPPAFAQLMTVLHIPMSLMLLGIVLRGSAFTFRSYDSRRDSVQRRWGRIFAIASTATPLLLGTILGAIVTGAVGAQDPTTATSFAEAYVSPWLSPFPIAVGVLTLLLFAFLAAVYLTVESPDADVRDDFRARALWSAVAVAVVAVIVLLLARSEAPLVWHSLMEGSFAMALRIAATVAALGAMFALWRRSFRAARIAAIVEVSLITWGWALGQFPYIIPPELTVQSAAAPASTLELLLIALAVGLAILLPSLRYLFKIFKAGYSKLS